MMNTPIADFVRNYAESSAQRLHMPGHKGKVFIGCEHYDITEVEGADALYEASGIIDEAETNASKLFGTKRTLFSTEGSSQCIRAMLYLAILNFRKKHYTDNFSKKRIKVVAARNVHKSFIYAAALLDFDPIWLFTEDKHSERADITEYIENVDNTGNVVSAQSICSCPVSTKALEQLLIKLRDKDEIPACVYLTSPDYLGGQQDIRSAAEICHRYGTLLAVDNAHGAYLHFLDKSEHPIDLGADICCDSAHKTLPVLTGGAYLHIANEDLCDEAKNAMALFGSTSPSYLTLMSLDLCNAYLADGYRDKLKRTINHINKIKDSLRAQGRNIYDSDPLKLTIEAAADESGIELADRLRKHGIEAEFSDPDYLVLMITPQNDAEILDILPNILGFCSKSLRRALSPLPKTAGEQLMSVRDAVFAVHETVPVAEAKGRICGAPTVSCPPAIPIAVSGEKIGEQVIGLFNYYDIKYVDVVRF